MGARTSHVSSSRWDLNQLAKATGLSRTEIDRFYSDYVEASGKDGIMDMDEFIDLYSHLPIARTLSKGEMKDQAVRIFRAFDQDESGTLSFDEFLTAIIVINSDTSQDDRVNFLVQENSTLKHKHSNERISSEYGHQIFQSLNEYHGLPRGTEHKYWKELDRNNRGYVTQEELVEYIIRHPDYNR
jgi:Ca2+-binding EF-hand superfamily protein